MLDGMDAAALARLTGAARAEWRASTTSVLDDAHLAGEAGAPSGTLLVADAQSAGRGRAGRTWHSPPGAGLWMALLWRPHEAPQGGTLALRAGLATAVALEAAAPELAIGLKWPNDLIAADRKAGGILCEARWTGARLGWVAVGVGVNLRGPLAPEVRAHAVALGDLAPGLTRSALLAALVPRLQEAAGAPPVLTDAERAEFLRRAWWPPGAGRVEDLAPDGTLLLRRADGSLDRRTSPP